MFVMGIILYPSGLTALPFTSSATPTSSWKAVWALQLPPKVVWFIWRCMHNAIAVFKELHKKKVLTGSSCPICGGDQESVMHMLCFCDHACCTWWGSTLGVRFPGLRVSATKLMEITEKEIENKGLDNQALVDTSGVTEKEAEERERQARELKSGLHPLKVDKEEDVGREHKFVFWYTRRTPGIRTQTSYEDNIKKIVEFSTVEAFWVCYCHLARPSSLPSQTDLHLFKEGIRPLWEDAANCNGGKWIIRFKKAISGRFWEDLVWGKIQLFSS
ncbi:hypothetical protein HHK36_012087 [Tetracentron sinense]|uniref:mRNA cap-binding protein n=1 Tax=Tetracentron sinense TaxID=13715 RepID=A0A834ZC31_TETSI|nr:hypothetical protein HHK36_012087 [Tetracentron sinense]